ncbi:MAG: sigma-70 family RNA polymerase sigma factor [Verrucomicrobiae bacterium]|nr:sigma-70 family RNA polymerase sigma factor [Verrucomicrobiae bacterium]NNJ42642.1 sigma-70 family RNA polymerase sigma factor [Akkermansiaceae bacterium]
MKFVEKNNRKRNHHSRKEAKIVEAKAKHENYLLNFARSLTSNNKVQAEDVVQLVWVNLLNNPKGADYLDLPCLINNVRWRFGDLQRREGKYVEYKEGVNNDSCPTYEQHSSPKIYGEHHSEQEQKNNFWEMFPTIELTEKQKEVVWLRIYHKYSFKQISDIAGIPKATAHDWIIFCRKQFVTARSRNPQYFSLILGGTQNGDAIRKLELSYSNGKYAANLFNKLDLYFWIIRQRVRQLFSR